MAMAFFAFIGWMAVYFLGAESGSITVDPVVVHPGDLPRSQTVEPAHASAWFQGVRPYCNPVDVETRLRWQPAPDSDQGRMYEAACYALAGKIDLARQSILQLPTDLRHRAAGVVFDVGHPAADAGDELAAGPLMELVVEFWPDHYMALYHAGAAAFEMGDRKRAHGYLTRFLEHYSVDDGWTRNAVSMLERLKS
ncbi:MAG: hypothetical protein R3253_10125 [Longimicrobiales bacterium]|nr:hypothetical protein [Longimicrobiales bacterium]